MNGIVEDFGVPVREINGIFFALTWSCHWMFASRIVLKTDAVARSES